MDTSSDVLSRAGGDGAVRTGSRASATRPYLRHKHPVGPLGHSVGDVTFHAFIVKASARHDDMVTIFRLLRVVSSVSTHPFSVRNTQMQSVRRRDDTSLHRNVEELYILHLGKEITGTVFRHHLADIPSLGLRIRIGRRERQNWFSAENQPRASAIRPKSLVVIIPPSLGPSQLLIHKACLFSHAGFFPSSLG